MIDPIPMLIMGLCFVGSTTVAIMVMIGLVAIEQRSLRRLARKVERRSL